VNSHRYVVYGTLACGPMLGEQCAWARARDFRNLAQTHRRVFFGQILSPICKPVIAPSCAATSPHHSLARLLSLGASLVAEKRRVR